jgi:3-oxoacyl-[acyl-carrier protein] reductase
MNILITGGSKGLGSAIVKQLAANPDNHIYFTYCHSEDLAIAITAAYPNTTRFFCDFSNEESVVALTDSISEMSLDILINNAAINFSKNHFHKLSVAIFRQSFQLNIAGTITITQAALTAFRKKKSGRVISVLSSAIIGTPPVGWAEYVANKNYLLSLSRSWATENIRFNITSNCVSPSFMATDFNKETDSRIVEEIIEKHPLKRLLTIEEVADTVQFLCNCSLHLNGVNIVMNAGVE